MMLGFWENIVSSGKELLENSIETLFESLMLGYKQSRKYPSTVIGNERELLIEALLKRALPSNIRYGSGVIMDSRGYRTGQVDIVLECQNSFSLPITSGKQRLYFADTVAAAIEVKSDLNKQKVEAFVQNHSVKKLFRKKTKEDFIDQNEYTVPSYIIAFKGAKTETIDKWVYQECREKRQFFPTGILCLEPAYFYAFEPNGDIIKSSGSWAVFAFLCSLSNWADFNKESKFDVKSYFQLLTGTT